MWSNLIFGQMRDFSVVLILSWIPGALNKEIDYFNIVDSFLHNTGQQINKLLYYLA